MARNGMRRQDIDLAGYSMTSGTAKNGSFYATFRQLGKPTLTSFGQVAERLVVDSVQGKQAKVSIAGGFGRTARIDAVRCPITGLDIREGGRMAAVPVGSGERLPVAAARAAEAEPQGFWSRLREGAREWLGIRDEGVEPASEQPNEAARVRSGYPVVDDLIDRIGVELETRPHLADENGSRFDALADRYLLEMASNHASAVKEGTREQVMSADWIFAEYVAIADQSLSESVRREKDLEANGRMDRLSTDLAFIRARQGVAQDDALRIVAEPTDERLALPGGQRDRVPLGKGPGQVESDAVVVLHAQRRGGREG